MIADLIFLYRIFLPWHLEFWLSAASQYCVEKQIIVESMGLTETCIYLLTRRFPALFGLGGCIVSLFPE